MRSQKPREGADGCLLRASRPRFSEGRFEIFAAQRQICILQASPALSEHQVDLAELPSLPLLVLWQLVSEGEPEGSEVLPVLPPVAARPSAGLVPGRRGAGGSGFLPLLADPNISKACKVQELTAVPPDWCPRGQRSNYSSALPQPRHHRGMCCAYIPVMQRSRQPKRRKMQEIVQGGRRGAWKGSERPYFGWSKR